MASNESGYWQCQGCGAILTKEPGSASKVFLEMGVTVMGGRTCEKCGTRHETADIYSGKFDMCAPDALIASAIQDRRHTAWDANAEVWKYKGQELRGSESFESLRRKRPSNVRHFRSVDGKIIGSTLSVDRYHLAQADATEIEGLLESIAAQIRESGSFQPCLLSFVGFDDDPRAVCQIAEVRRWCAAAWDKAPALVPMLEQGTLGASRMLMFCLLNVEVQPQGQGQFATASFAFSMDEYKPILAKAYTSGWEFLESCGYRKTEEYLNEWLKSVIEPGS